MTRDWRIYELLRQEEYWRPGDEPPVKLSVNIHYKGREIVVPLPEGAEVEILAQEERDKRDKQAGLR